MNETTEQITTKELRKHLGGRSSMVRSRFSLTFEEACVFLGYRSRTTLSVLINSSSPTLWEGVHYTCTGKEKRFDPDKLQDWLDTPRLQRKVRRPKIS